MMRLILFIIFLLIIISASRAEEYEIEKYTDKERIALDQFRVIVNESIVREYEKYDAFLIAWLRAKKLNLNEATHMFVTAQKWRINNHIDTIVNETIFNFTPSLYTIDGFDKKGHPIVIITPTHSDTRRLLLQGGKNKLLRLFYQFYEKGFIETRVASKIFKKHITKITLILDINGFNLRQHFCLACISGFRDWAIAFEKYYPELAEHFIIINIPRIAIPLIQILRPILSENTNKAIKLFSLDRHEWSTYLNEIISPDQLSYKYGGIRGKNIYM